MDDDYMYENIYESPESNGDYSHSSNHSSPVKTKYEI